ncbi:F-box protein At3g07870-like [Salvia hispanica]|uniref:F-box protein At3g07870-like n=1 Tax=Salvia hispanica TaxID=49212 RepID=UPI00200947BA|nr:F-box protein At3g07870-like [Salvia hispanica]
MEPNSFKNLPSQLTTNILSRLPLRSISISKCVCKPWLNLLQSDDFVKSKLKTPPALIRLMPDTNSTQCAIFEFKDEDEADAESHDLQLFPLADFDIPHGNSAAIYRARQTNGLLLLYSSVERHVYICNPITREYIELCCPADYISILNFGFGVSKLSGKYKVICIIVAGLGSGSTFVYTLGTGIWRRVEPGPASGRTFDFNAYVVCNGNLHWTVYDSAKVQICAFDLETECFGVLSPPAVVYGLAVDVKLIVWRDCLCLYYRLDDKVVIWQMKEYQVKESWTIKCEISIDYSNGFGVNRNMNVYPIKIFENVDDIASVMVYTPSLFSLKNFGGENVISF